MLPPMVMVSSWTRIEAVTVTSLPNTLDVPVSITVPALSYAPSSAALHVTGKLALSTVPSAITAGRLSGSTGSAPLLTVVE